ncbi:MAG: hypothetical protein EOO94_01770 [Pedobacter sp.]|nr:MAG: hypothetical protein EOO94_01770 [Pedobacter sp.]
MQYAQYNNTIETGYRVDSARLVNNGAQVMNVARYYRADNNSKFSNKYHFIEVPVYLHTQLNKSKTIPLYWNVGVTVSQMFASNALIFDGGTGVYYKDEKFYHNTQVAAGTGFSVGLLSGSKFPVWIGPSARYQATQLFTNQISGKKHLMSASMDIRVILNHK